MLKIKECLSFLKYFGPKVISIDNKGELIGHVAFLSEHTMFKSDTVYIGKLSDVKYRLYSIEHQWLFLINDSNESGKDIKSGTNSIVLFPNSVDIDELFEQCRTFIFIQDSVSKKSQKIMEAYLSNDSLQNVLDVTADIIKNPLIVIDNGYRVMGSSNDKDCEDLEWKQSIQNGYCSYEFISHFCKLSEIQSSQSEEAPVLVGCMMSPMRRCISKIMVNHKRVGYLLSIEAFNPFDEEKVQLLDYASRIFSKILLLSALESGKDIYHTGWDLIINVIEKRDGSVEILKEYMKKTGFNIGTEYIVILVKMDNKSKDDAQVDSIHNIFHDLFPKCIFCYYEDYIVLLVEPNEDSTQVLAHIIEKKEILRKKQLIVTVSDSFKKIEGLSRYYMQAKRAADLIRILDSEKIACSYDDVRRYDMLLSKPIENDIPLFLRTKERLLYEYDKEHGTDYFKTLYFYVKHSRSLQEVSDELFIHKNTVSYRIGRIRELFDIDLNDGETRIGFYLAYQMLELYNKGYVGNE